MAAALRIALLLLLVPVARGAPGAESHAFRIEREVERVAASRELWPGFEPLEIPLAIFDGERTYLFRHPSPPADFRPVTGDSGPGTVLVCDGRYPAVTANTSADLGGTSTATLLADGPDASSEPARLAAVALHESFHVYQRAHHPGWIGNEGDLLLYPFEDAELLTLRRLETDALRRALAAADDGPARCEARRALALRRERFARLAPAFSAYERGTELNEGLAAYVQLLATPNGRVEVPAAGFAPGDVRLRVYTVGPALAVLLDRFAPDWRVSLEEHDGQHLDALLGAALEREPTGAMELPCGPTAAERAALESAARADAAGVERARAERLRAFRTRPGWRLVIVAPAGRPLQLAGFDPLNVERVEGGLIHGRLLSLAGDTGRLDVLNEGGSALEAFTVGTSGHPLFQGVTRVVIAGLAEPDVDEVDGRLVLSAPGLAAEFAGARLDPGATDTELVLMLDPSD